MKKFFAIVSVMSFCFLAALLAWRFWPNAAASLTNVPIFYQQSPHSYNAATPSPSTALPKTYQSTIKSNHSPALVQAQQTVVTLTRDGIVTLTNAQRSQNGGLPALTENSLLDRSAQLKLKDLFANQYFAHISPSGVGPEDLAKTVGYTYVEVGENLALGDFTGNQDLIDSWMASPGHRANILNAKFKETGAAAGQGNYQGSQVWIAVQEFGKPASSCPEVDLGLKAELNSLQAAAAALQEQINPLKSQIDASQPQTQAQYDAYNQLMAQFNSLVDSYNNKVDQLKLITNQYNSEVSAYNACAQ